MAGTKISNLTAVTTAQLTDTLPAVQSGVTYKETLQQVLTLFNPNIQLASTSQVTGLNTALGNYLPVAGGTMTGALYLSTSSPATSLEAASKGYVDATAAGFTTILLCNAATTANLNATPAGAGVGATLTNAGAMAAFQVDGYSASVNDRILVKNQTLSQHNGIYTVTTVGSGAVNWVLTRATDYDQAAEIQPGTLIPVQSGTANANTSWLETATVVTVDTDPVVFAQFTFAPGSYLQVANNLSDVANTATSRTNLGLGNVATRTASDVAKTYACMLDAAPTIGNIAVFTDTNGTIGDGGPPASITLNPLCTGRLTLTSNIPVTTSNVTAATTIYFTPYKGNKIALYDGVSNWDVLTLTEISIAVPGTTSTMYDVFCYNNSGTPTLELTAWTNDTTRATALTFQDGIYVKSGSTTRRYLGSFRTTTVAGQTEDSKTNRYVWNYYNRIFRPMNRTDATASWTYSVAAYRQANNNTSNQLNFVIGVAEDNVIVNAVGRFYNSTSAYATGICGIGLNRTNANDATQFNLTAVNNITPILQWASYNGVPAEGRNYLAWLEYGNGSLTQTWFGSNNNQGISGYLRG